MREITTPACSRCHHAITAHEHYHSATYCGWCGRDACPAYQRRRRPTWLEVELAALRLRWLMWVKEWRESRAAARNY